MVLEIINENILACNADAILLTIDGSKKGMEGNIARAFARKNPDLWEDMEERVIYPIPLGQAIAFPVDDFFECDNKIIIIASTLHHLGVLTEEQKLHVIKSALYNALILAIKYRATSVSSAVLSGGWRLTPTLALQAMIEVYSRLSASRFGLPILRICILEKNDFDELTSYFADTGISFAQIPKGYRCNL